jgi:signal transduction histidine kinase
VLGAQEEGAGAAIDTLRSLSRGVQPRVLREEGLAPALRLVAESSPLPVRLTTSTTTTTTGPAGTGGPIDPGRLHPDTEAALYFCGLEALQNAVKHARASTAEIRLLVGPGRTELTVADDGTGIATSHRGGTGLANMRARVAALGGSVRIVSTAGAGTRVVATVPTRAVAR